MVTAKTVATGQKATRQAGGFARARLGKRKGTSAQERHQGLNFPLQSPLLWEQAFGGESSGFRGSRPSVVKVVAPVGADLWW